MQLQNEGDAQRSWSGYTPGARSGGREGGRGRGDGFGRGFGGRGEGARGRGGRGRGGGRSDPLPIVESRKRSSADARLTEVSPVKPDNPNVVAPPLLEWKEPGVIEQADGKGVSKQLCFAEEPAKTYEAPVGVPPPPPSARELKKPKKQVGSSKKDKNVNISAASGVGDRREQ